jgi:glycosyltransferase involved in cell wall biosynthesis
MRVAVLGIKTLPAFAGADRVVEQLLAHFSEENEYSIYLIRDGRPRMCCTDSRHYVYVPALRGKHLRAPSYFLLCCLHFLVKGNSEVVHVHNSDFGIFCWLLKLKRGVRIIGTFHGDPATREKWSRFAKVLLRASEAAFVHACDTLTSVSPDKDVARHLVHYIPNGVARQATSPIDEAQFPYQSLGLTEGEFVMFACGRLDRTKGLHHLIAAYRDVQSTARLLVVGDFSHDSRYAQEITDAAVGDDRIVLHKSLLDEASLIGVLRKCAVFVFPSEIEGMSMMLLEAVMFGRLVICSDIPANVAVVGEDYRFLFRSRDVSSLRAALEGALDGEEPNGSVGSLRKRVSETFRWERIALEYEAQYCLRPNAISG